MFKAKERPAPEPTVLDSKTLYALLAMMRAGGKLSSKSVDLYKLLLALAPTGAVIMPYAEESETPPVQAKTVRKLGEL